MKLFDLLMLGGSRRTQVLRTLPLPGFYLLGMGDGAYVSLDGDNWFRYSIGYTYVCAWFKNRIIAGVDGAVLRYSDPLTKSDIASGNITFTQASFSSQSLGNLIDMATDGNILVGVFGGSSASTIAYTLDGITWTGVGKPFTRLGTRVKWTGTEFIAAGQGTAGTLYRSSDGISWTMMMDSSIYGSSDSQYSGVINDFSWNGTSLLTVGYKGDLQSTTDMAISYDNGATWEGFRNGVETGRTYSVEWDGTRYVVGCYGKYLIFSTNGRDNWTKILTEIPMAIHSICVFEESLVASLNISNTTVGASVYYLYAGGNTIEHTELLATSTSYIGGNKISILDLTEILDELPV